MLIALIITWISCLALLVYRLVNRAEHTYVLQASIADLHAKLALIEHELQVLNDNLHVTQQEEEVAEEHEEDTHNLSEYESDLLRRQSEFTARISRIKDELSNKNARVTPSKPADVLHPDVHNLPHGSVAETSYYDKEEFAE